MGDRYVNCGRSISPTHREQLRSGAVGVSHLRRSEETMCGAQDGSLCVPSELGLPDRFTTVLTLLCLINWSLIPSEGQSRLYTSNTSNCMFPVNCGAVDLLLHEYSIQLVARKQFQPQFLKRWECRPHDSAEIDDMLCHRVAKRESARASAPVSRRGKVVYFKQFGLMDVESGKEFRQDTIVRIYSMTKAVTSAAALMLYDQGKISLDDPVEQYLPELADRTVYDRAGLRPAKTVMTIRHLLLHTSGFIYGTAEGTELERQYAERTC